MKKYYNTPSTQIQQIRQHGTICVVSVHSEEGLKYGGGSDGSDQTLKPF